MFYKNKKKERKTPRKNKRNKIIRRKLENYVNEIQIEKRRKLSWEKFSYDTRFFVNFKSTKITHLMI